MASLQRNTEELIQRWFFYNHWMENFVWKKYYTPDAKVPSVPISPRGQHHLEELRENGVTIIPGYEALADHLENTYFSVIDGRTPKTNQVMERVSYGERDNLTNSWNYRISFKDPALAPFIFDPDLCGILYNYYQRQPYFREQPWVIKNAKEEDLSFEEFTKIEVAAKFHIDCYRQITMMLLVNDLTEADTHLQYAIGSHKVRNTWNRYSYSDEDIVKRYPIQECVGPKGTLIIMDAGSGFHRAAHRRGTVRKTFQCLLTAGHYYPAREQKMSVKDWAVYPKLPVHMQRMYDDLRID